MRQKDRFQNALTNKIVVFLTEIGIEVEKFVSDERTFLPGILIKNGKILVDEEKLLFPGDLLHEAGHLAIAPANLRSQLNDEVALPEEDADALEAQAIIWSYAACLHLEIDPQVVFHESGYKNKSVNILFNFSVGVYPGLNGLEKNKMAFAEDAARKIGCQPFPKMHKWLRD